MASLRTAQEMLDYCMGNGLGAGSSKASSFKHFQLLADNIEHNEKVVFVFMGLQNATSASKHEGFYAYALTNKRLVLAQDSMGGSVVQSIDIKYIDKDHLKLSKTGLGPLGFGSICFNTGETIFNVLFNARIASNVYIGLNKALDKIK